MEADIVALLGPIPNALEDALLAIFLRQFGRIGLVFVAGEVRDKLVAFPAIQQPHLDGTDRNSKQEKEADCPRWGPDVPIFAVLR